MSKTSIPTKVKNNLWFAAHARCEFNGCNKRLDIMGITMDKCNLSNYAHIIADSPKGPRGDEDFSKELCSDEKNLILMCPECHKYIDHEGVDKFGTALLQKMKFEHEERINMVTGICPNKKSLIVYYGPNIGQDTPLFSDTTLAMVLFPERYPQDEHPIRIELHNSQFYDDESVYWLAESSQLERIYNNRIKARFDQKDIDHISLFAIAPQPLLVKLGTKLNDKYPVEVYQKHREPDTWSWQTDEIDNPFLFFEPQNRSMTPILVFAISSNAIAERIKSQFEGTHSIWIISCPNQNNDMLQAREQLKNFRKFVRKHLDDINSQIESFETLKIFLSMPAACAVELGRIRMPKADKKWDLHDYQRKDGKDIKTIIIE